MNNDDLDKLLRSVDVPGRDASHWADFPGAVSRAARRARARSHPPRPEPRRLPWPVWGVAIAAVCVLLGFAIGYWRGCDAAPSQAQLAVMQKYFLELNALFPNQIEAIVFDDTGPRVLLREHPGPAGSAPLFVRICTSAGCRSFITFSGQRVRVNGDTLEVLADAAGNIIVAGPRAVWSSAETGRSRSAYRIQARSLEANL